MLWANDQGVMYLIKGACKVMTRADLVPICTLGLLAERTAELRFLNSKSKSQICSHRSGHNTDLVCDFSAKPMRPVRSGPWNELKHPSGICLVYQRVALL